MKQLLDTHLLHWSALEPEKLSATVQKLIEDPENQLFFSLASSWETAIKFGRGRKDLTTHPLLLREGLLRTGFRGILVTIEHAAATLLLPQLHRDPFDRILIAQATV